MKRAAAIVLVLTAVVVGIVWWSGLDNDRGSPSSHPRAQDAYSDRSEEGAASGPLAEPDGIEDRRRELLVPETGGEAVEETPDDPGLKGLLGKVTISGRVVEGPERFPVSGAALLVAREPAGHGLFLPEIAAPLGRSEPSGFFVLPGAIDLTADGGRHVVMAACSRGIGWKTVAAVPGLEEITGIEIKLAPTAALSIQVLDEAGFALPGVLVRVEPGLEPLTKMVHVTDLVHRLSPGKTPEVTELFLATTGSAGVARFPFLPVDRHGTDYRVLATRDGYNLAWKDMINLDPGSDVTVQLELHEHRPCSVLGQVLTWEGAAVPGALIRSFQSGGAIGEATSDAVGSWRIDGLDPRLLDARFEASAEGYLPSSTVVRLPQDSDRTSVTMRLVRPGRVAGRVVDDRGEPVEGARVVLGQGQRMLELPTEGSRTGPDGCFEFTEVSSVMRGQLLVTAPEPLDEWLVDAVGKSVLGRYSQDVTVVLTRLRTTTARLTAEVVDAATGVPLPPADVRLTPMNEETARLDFPSLEIRKSVGSVVIEPVLPGAWRLWVHVDGRIPGYTDLIVYERESEVFARVLVGSPGSIVGRVLFDETRPSRDASVEAWFADEFEDRDADEWTEGAVFQQSAEVNPDGSFRIDALVPGRWTIELEAEGLLGKVETVVPSGKEAFVDIEPILGAILQFRSAVPFPPGDVRVHVAEAGTEEWRSLRGTRVREDGSFRVEGTVPPGRLQWNFYFYSSPSGRSFTLEGLVDAAAGRRKVVEVSLPDR